MTHFYKAGAIFRAKPLDRRGEMGDNKLLNIPKADYFGRKGGACRGGEEKEIRRP